MTTMKACPDTGTKNKCTSVLGFMQKQIRAMRDRYGVVLPIEYDEIRILDPSMPYWKVERDNKWQIYDINLRELVSEERFDEIIPCNKNVYQLKSENVYAFDEETGEMKLKAECIDKYLTLPEHWYYDKVQRAIITEEQPEEFR